MWKSVKSSNNSKQPPTDQLRILTIYPTMQCNCRCKMCHIWGECGWALKDQHVHKTGHLDFKAITRFISEARQESGPFWVMVSGGEPTLYQELSPLLSYLKSLQLPVMLLTNGLKIESFYRDIIKNVDILFVSMDGPQAVHDKIRGIRGAFDTICCGIERIIEYKQSAKALLPIIYTNFVISHYSEPFIIPFVNSLQERFAKQEVKLGYEHWLNPQKGRVDDIIIAFEPLLFTYPEYGAEYEREMRRLFSCSVSDAWKGFLQKTPQNPKKTSALLTKIWQDNSVAAHDFVDLTAYFTDITDTFGRKRCMAPRSSLVIRQNGEVFFCPDHPDYALGNIHQQDFLNIWRGERAMRFRAVLDKQLLSICYRCCRLFFDYDWPLDPARALKIMKKLYIESKGEC